MSHHTLISAQDLSDLVAAGPPPVLLDCGFDLAHPDAGALAYAQGHLPGAHHAHLDLDLSGLKTGRNGRHPLPERPVLAASLARWGITPGQQVVCYDDQGMPYASRAWWLLRWMGHVEVAVLDGGRAAWLATGAALTTLVPATTDGAPYPQFAAAMPTVQAAELMVDLADLAAPAAARRWFILDARAGERFRGEVEPLDAVAGHIPGAHQRFFRNNLGSDGRFKPITQLRAEFDALGARPGTVVQQCGSGVTACHNLLAMAHAGLGDSTLYPGSWSEWCSDPQRPVARG